MSLPRFVFVVHALTVTHRRVMGVRMGSPAILFALRDGTEPSDIGVICRFELENVAEGIVVGVPMSAQQLLDDQDRALDRMRHAIELVEQTGPVDAVGLGSLCAVVASRGEALGESIEPPVTNGGAATAWALFENTWAVWQAQEGQGPVAVIGANSPVGRAVACLLSEKAVPLRVDGKRGGRGLGATICASPEETVQGCQLIVGAGPTGNSLDPAAVEKGAVLIDVALPDTLRGPAPAGVQVLAGEAVSTPTSWRRGFWGTLYQIFAGYGPHQVFACLIEPLVLAASPRNTSWSIGRKLTADTVRRFGEQARALGFAPRLARVWWEVPIDKLVR